jgi:hypothetical protein
MLILHLPHHDTDSAALQLLKSGVWCTRVVTDITGRRLLQLPTREAAAAAMLILRERFGTTGQIVNTPGTH